MHRAAYLVVFDQSLFDQFVAIQREGDVIGFVYGLAFSGIGGKAIFCPVTNKSNCPNKVSAYNSDLRAAICYYHSYGLRCVDPGSDTDTTNDVVRFWALPNSVQSRGLGCTEAE